MNPITPAAELGVSDGVYLAVFIFYTLLFLGIYVYSSLALMAVAKKKGDKQPWLAWVPVGNLYLMSRIAKMHWWPLLLLVLIWLPGFNTLALLTLGVFYYIWTWKICEAGKKPGWWSLLTLIPIFGGIWYFVMWGVLAWSEK